MAEFPVNPKRVDPYANFKFKVKWDGKYVCAVSKVSGLSRSTEVIEFRSGGDPSMVHRQPGQTKFEAITLERGVTQDEEFAQWVNKVWDLHAGAGKETSLADFRKDIIIELYNEAGQKVLSYNVYRCWPSEFKALPDLDAKANDVAIQTLKLENEGWVQDYSYKEPKEPSYTIPSAS